MKPKSKPQWKQIDTATRAVEILKILKKHYPQSHTAIGHENPFQLLIATILSAQCTDERVNMVTPGLFAKYPGPQNLADVSQEELEREIRSTGFYRNKSKLIRGCSRDIIGKFGGTVPETMEELLTLPGVGRKTANCVLGNALGKLCGIVVDTHVHRIVVRLGLSDKKNADKVEQDLMAIFPKRSWIDLSNMLIDHGRKICNARKPLCAQCPLLPACPTGAENVC